MHQITVSNPKKEEICFTMLQINRLFILFDSDIKIKSIFQRSAKINPFNEITEIIKALLFHISVISTG